MTIYVCDKCGKREEDIHNIKVVDGKMKFENVLHDLDLCDDCFSKLQEFMTNKSTDSQ